MKDILKDTLNPTTVNKIENTLAHKAHGNLNDYDVGLLEEVNNLDTCLLAYIAYKDYKEQKKSENNN